MSMKNVFGENKKEENTMTTGSIYRPGNTAPAKKEEKETKPVETGCEYCQIDDSIKQLMTLSRDDSDIRLFMIGKSLFVADSEKGDSWAGWGKIAYCPMCGRKLD